ncbi:MAG: hypothetical protein IPJ03_16870 [Ignavibacteriales bacterium]|nr:hypothetical protein [Ignavibacteriales bacterium]
MPETAQDILKQINLTPGQVESTKQQLEREICRRDLAYFINEYVKIEDRDVEGIVIPFKLWDSQKPILEDFTNERLLQIMKANQLGLTWLIIAYATWRMIFNTGFSVKAISETEIKAKEITRRIDFILRHLPKWFITDQKSERQYFESTALSVTIYHGTGKEESNIQAFASSPKAGASFTANLFLFDEWALQESAREIWTYAFPTINRPTGGQVIGISTIERGTLFEDIWRGNNGFKKIFLGWFSDPRRDEAWYANTLRELGLDETRKHYPATPEEALAIPGGAYFHKFDSIIHIRQPLEKIPDYYVKYRAMDYGFDMLACYFLWVDNYGNARVYKEICKPDLVISQAAYYILQASGADVPDSPEVWDSLTPEIKQKIAMTAKDKFAATYAPPDLFEKSKENKNKSLDLVWIENGITLTKSSKDFENGCIMVNQWLEPYITRDVATGEEYRTAKLTIDRDAAPKLVNSFLNIQKDKNRPEVYSKTPHELTHQPDGIRYFCSGFIQPGIDKQAEAEKKMQELRDTPYPQFKMAAKKLYDKQLRF